MVKLKKKRELVSKNQRDWKESDRSVLLRLC